MDLTVSINEAEKIYRTARHPKSFVSLDDADHLLTKARDSEYVATTTAAWASRFIPDAEAVAQQTSALHKGHVMVAEKTSSSRALYCQTPTYGWQTSQQLWVAATWARTPESTYWPLWVPVPR